MSETTSRMNYTYPSRDEDPWYDSFESLVTALDSSTFAHREDRSLVFAGGGTLSWTVGTSTLTWDDTVQIASTISGRRISVSANSLTMADGQILYLELTRQPLQNISTSFQVADQLPSTNNACAVAVRLGGVVYFRTGISLTDGSTSPDIAPVPSAGGGGPGSDTTAIHDNQAGEIAAIGSKGTPTTSDLLLIEDAASGNAKAKITIGDLPAATPATHAIGGSEHSSSTLAQLNALISDATIDGTGDPRTDNDAIHDNVAGEIVGITSKGSPTASDVLIIEDVADSNSKKSITIGSLPGGSGTDPDAIHDNVAGEIVAITEKTAPVGADVLVLEDSGDGNNKKRVSVFNLPAGRVVSVKDYGATGDGITDDYASINSAITAIGASEADLLFPAGDYYIGTNVSSPINIRPVFDRGARIEDNGDASRLFTVAYSGGIKAGPYQIFNFTGAGSGAIFTNEGEGYINWWCDGGDGTSGSPWTSTYDNMAGVEAAITSGLNLVRLTTGEYSASSTMSVSEAGIVVRGEDRAGSVYNYSQSTGTTWEFTGASVFLEDFRITGPGTAGSDTAVRFASGGSGAHYHMKGFLVRDVGRSCVLNDGFWVTAHSTYLFNAGFAAWEQLDSGGVVTIGDGCVFNTSQYGVYFTGGCNNFSMQNMNVESCDYGIWAGGASAAPRFLPLRNIHFESCAISDMRLGGGTKTAHLDNCRFSGVKMGAEITGVTGGPFQAGETVTFDLGGKNITATLDSFSGDIYRFTSVSDAANVAVGDSVDGGTSGAQGTVNKINTALDFNAATNLECNLNGGWFDDGSTRQIVYQSKLNVIVEPDGFDYEKVERGSTSDNANSSIFLGVRQNSAVTSGTGEQDLRSAVIPQFAQNVYHTVRIKAGGTKSGGNGDCTLKFYFGATPVTFHPAQTNEFPWQFEIEIQMYDNNSHRAVWIGRHSGRTTNYSTFTDDLDAGSLTVKVTGECANASDVISNQFFRLEME